MARGTDGPDHPRRPDAEGNRAVRRAGAGAIGSAVPVVLVGRIA